MTFKPRIFISSTFKENKEIRKKIQEHFLTIGAEPLLYEKNLTPSTIPMTYRTNIIESDFVILIIKDEYGTKTDWDMSGTHEEYCIAKNHGIPTHVYLKTGNIDNPLVSELNKDQVSIFYFKDDNELMKRLKETTFIIAEEIAQNKIINSKLPEKTAKTISVNSDYNRAITIIKIVDSMIELNDRNEVDWLDTNLVLEFMGFLWYEYSGIRHKFSNWKLDELLTDMLMTYCEFAYNYEKDYTLGNERFKIENSIIGSTTIHNSHYHQNTKLTSEDYIKLLKKILRKYNSFKSLVKDMKIEIDSI